MEEDFEHKGHEVSVWTDQRDAGWVWTYTIDGKGRRMCTKPLPLEGLALKEGAMAARLEIDAGEAEGPFRRKS